MIFIFIRTQEIKRDKMAANVSNSRNTSPLSNEGFEQPPYGGLDLFADIFYCCCFCQCRPAPVEWRNRNLRPYTTGYASSDSDTGSHSHYGSDDNHFWNEQHRKSNDYASQNKQKWDKKSENIARYSRHK